MLHSSAARRAARAPLLLRLADRRRRLDLVRPRVVLAALHEGLLSEGVGERHKGNGDHKHESHEEAKVGDVGRGGGAVGVGDEQVDECGEEVAQCGRGEEEGHHRRLHLGGRLRVSELEAGHRDEHLGRGEDEVREQLQPDARRLAGSDARLDVERQQEGGGEEEEAGRDLAQRRHAHDTAREVVQAGHAASALRQHKAVERGDEEEDEQRVDASDLRRQPLYAEEGAVHLLGLQHPRAARLVVQAPKGGEEGEEGEELGERRPPRRAARLAHEAGARGRDVRVGGAAEPHRERGGGHEQAGHPEGDVRPRVLQQGGRGEGGEEGACVDGEVEGGEGRGEQRLVGGAELVAEHRGDAWLDASRADSDEQQPHPK
mmetsp:Transcript_14853/g.49327  ORF Transcript_14853/g.49327 Transcript_14853/m.49327 type:complete len:374 (+) Transcript_14853:1203-2324(+)